MQEKCYQLVCTVLLCCCVTDFDVHLFIHIYLLGNVSAVLFDDTNRFMLTCGSRRIHIFHNVVGLQATLPDLESKLSKTKNDAAKNSLLQQIGSTKYVF